MKIKVIFRVFKDGGDVLALFPDEPWNSEGCCASYQHTGQHGAASYHHCLDITRLAKPSEYKDLASELTSIGYNLQVRKRA